MSFDGEPIYLGETHPKAREIIDRLTEPKNWGYQQFKKVVIASAGTGQYIPSYNRPDTIHIQGLRPHIEKLKAITAEKGKETARVVFADIDKRTLVVSGRTTIGSEHSVRLDTRPQPGRERYQKRALSIHVHPQSPGLSDADFKKLLADREQLGMLMISHDNVFIVLKTSVTPNNLELKAIEKRIEAAKSDYFEANKVLSPYTRLVAFNKAVCSEFGLILLMTSDQTKDLATRVEVTK